MDMPTKRIVQDPDFGRIEIRTNRRARNITMRPKDDGLHVTVPPYTSFASVLKAIEPHRQTLREGCEKLRPRLIDLDFTIDAPCFKLCVASGTRQFFSVRFDDDKATVFCPPDTQFSRPEVQKLLSAAVSGIALSAKDDSNFSKAMVSVTLVEIYALLSFIVSLLVVITVPNLNI